MKPEQFKELLKDHERSTVDTGEPAVTETWSRWNRRDPIVLDKAEYEKTHKGLTYGYLKYLVEQWDKEEVSDDTVIWGLDLDTMEAKQAPYGGYHEGFRPIIRRRGKDIVIGFSRRPSIEFDNEHTVCYRYIRATEPYVEHSRFCTEGDPSMLTCDLAVDSERVDFGYN